MPGKTTRPHPTTLAEVPLFHGVEPATLAALEAHAAQHHLEAGSWLFREGDPADSLFVVVSGRLRVVITDDDGPRVIRELGPGSALGELALLTGSARSAGAQAVRDCELLEVGRSTVTALLDEDGGFARAVAVELARQLQASGGLEAPTVRPRVFSIVPLAPGIDAARFATSFQRELQRYGTVALLDGGGVADDRAAALARAEAAADFVLVVAGTDSGAGSWGAFARRQADRVLLLADSDTPIGSHSGDCDLVLLAPLPRGAAAEWLDAVSPSTHHVVYEAAYDIGVAGSHGEPPGGRSGSCFPAAARVATHTSG